MQRVKLEDGYFCAECNAPADVDGEKITRSCSHTGLIDLRISCILDKSALFGENRGIVRKMVAGLADLGIRVLRRLGVG
jgi:hypothetical protein